MTRNQLEYLGLVETKRNNIVVATENNRHNVAGETETNRHNLVNEEQTNRSLVETNRHNIATENNDRYRTDKTFEASKYATDTNAAVARETAAMQQQTEYYKSDQSAKTAKTVAKINKSSNVKSSKISANASKSNAKTQAAATKYSADKSAQASKYSADSQAAASKYATDANAAIQRAHDLSSQLQTAWTNQSKEKIAQIQTESNEYIKSLDRMFSKYNVDKTIKKEYDKLKADYQKAMDAKKYDVAIKLLDKIGAIIPNSKPATKIK